MILAALAALVWLYLAVLHADFWRSTPELAPAAPATPALPVDIVVPARDEAAHIGAVIASLLAQDYPGDFRVILVDDGSTDGTADRARQAAQGDPRFVLIAAPAKPPGWAGKLWALDRGIASGASPCLLLTDADITHDPRHLATLMARLEQPIHGARLDLVSEMVALRCVSRAERALIPAFVYFFQMLYPFARVNDPFAATAAAAGGVVLLRRDALTAIGGFASMRSALIDDVTLAQRIKRRGAIFLGHSGLARSIRPYPAYADIRAMIARSAFTQLRRSYALLILTIALMALIWLVPPLALIFGRGTTRLLGLIAFVTAMITYMPTLRRYGQHGAWALALPLIALAYLEATIASARHHARGTGTRWKNRAYPSRHDKAHS